MLPGATPTHRQWATTTAAAANNSRGKECEKIKRRRVGRCGKRERSHVSSVDEFFLIDVLLLLLYAAVVAFAVVPVVVVWLGDSLYEFLFDIL